MYLEALENGFLANYEDALLDITNIKDAAKKILMLAAETIAGPDRSIHLHSGIPELKEKEIRDVVELVGMKDPDVASMLERSMATDLIREFGSSGIVYDLSAIRYYGSGNDLARYGHYYHINGENREINFVLAVTRKHGIPIHYRTIAGNIPSVSTIHAFSGELKDYGLLIILIVIDRGFYSADNLNDLKGYSLIGALPSSLSIHDELTHRSRDIENSRNYMQYQSETIFSREERMRGKRYIVYFSPRLRSQRLESFFSRTEEGTRARLFLTILGYTMIAIMAAECNVTYNQVLETISGIREVVYANGYHAHVEYTKEERELMEKLKIEL